MTLTNKFTRGIVNRAHALSNKAISIDVTFNDLIKIYGLKVMKGKNGAFLSMPSTKGKDGNYYNVCYFDITPECKTAIFAQVINMLGETAAVVITE